MEQIMASRSAVRGRTDSESRAEKKSGGKKVAAIAISAILALGATAGGAAWYMNRAQNGPDAGAVEQPPVFVALDTFTVNLHSNGDEQHLQTNLTLKVNDARAAESIKLHMPEVRNRIVLLLSSKAASEILGVEGKKKLAAELVAEIKQPFSGGGTEQGVHSVLFTSFVIQ
jgi:flagellar FliL protein